MPNVPGHDEIFHEFDWVEDFLLPAAHESWHDTYGTDFDEERMNAATHGNRGQPPDEVEENAKS